VASRALRSGEVREVGSTDGAQALATATSDHTTALTQLNAEIALAAADFQNVLHPPPGTGTGQSSQDQQQQQSLEAQMIGIYGSGQALSDGVVPVYGMDGNSTAYQNLGQAGQLTGTMFQFIMIGLSFHPAGAVAIFADAGGIVISLDMGDTSSAAGFAMGLFGRVNCFLPKPVQWIAKALMAGDAINHVGNAWDALLTGDYGGAARELAFAGLDIIGLFSSCFAAGTPLLTPEGSKNIEDFQVGDAILSRNEADPNGTVGVQTVEEVFVRTGRIMHLHVGGQVIKTTPEHPFYVQGKGWLQANELAIGDLLSSHDGRWLPVEDLLDTGEYERVYNLRVSEYHTYFVGSDRWGWSVWAHNAVYKAERTGDGLQIGKRISEKIAVSRLRCGRDIYAASATAAKKLQQKAFGGTAFHEVDNMRPGHFPHFHDAGREGGHAFFGVPPI